MTKKIDFKNTPVGKAVRTAIQVYIALVPLVTVVVTTPEFKQAINGEVVWTAALFPVLVAGVTYIQNKLGK